MHKSITRFALRYFVKPVLHPRFPVSMQRRVAGLAGVSTPAARGVTVSQHTMGGVAVEQLQAAAATPGRHLLYLHGGGYLLGSAAMFRGLTSRLAQTLQAQTLVPNYRLAPEHPYPAAVDDAVSVWEAMLASGVDPAQAVIAGDSAGGGLTMATLLALRDRGLALPAAVILISPLVDLTLSGPTMTSKLAVEALLNPAWLAQGAEAYCAGRARTEPGCSPLFGELGGLPPLLIQVGRDEILLSDSERLAERAKAEGVDTTLQCWDGMWHDFQAHAGQLAEADEALQKMALFVDDKLKA